MKSKKETLVSYVVPLYNKQAYIAECLTCLQKQSIDNIEIIVVDDCSTDDSLEIAQFMAKDDKRIKVYHLDENKGRSYARNYGNKKANGDIIAVNDADDISSPHRTKVIQQAFRKPIDIFYSSFYCQDYTIAAKEFDIEEVKKDLFTYIGHSTMAYRRDVLDKIKYSEGKWSDLGCDDWKFQMDAYSKGMKFGFSEKPLVVYRTSGNSISKNRDENEIAELKKKYLGI